MWLLLWSTLLCFLIGFTNGGTSFSPAWMYTQSYLQKNIEIRLVKRDWKPKGPSAGTDDVMEEYRWGVDKAFKTLIKSEWKFESALLKDADKLFRSENFDKNLETIYIIHPICSSADVFFVKTTVTALAMRNLHKKYNIFAVNMPFLNPQMLLSVAMSAFGFNTYYEPMAKAVSELLVIGVEGGYIQPEQVHLLGWSYSGQLVGYMGRYLETRYGTKISSIMSLDPWANGLNRELIHVSADDARVVHVYHTNSLVAGTRERIGTADFIYNDGVIQPECEWPEVFKSSVKESMICSHLKVVQRFWYVILYPSKFIARKCGSWNRMVGCYCEDNSVVTMNYPINMDKQAQGIYYLRTLNTKPYGVGKWGVECSSDKLIFKEVTKEKHTIT